MKRALEFLKSPTGGFTMFFVFVTIGVTLFYESDRRAKREQAQLTKVETPPPQSTKETIIRGGKVFTAPSPAQKIEPAKSRAESTELEPRTARANRVPGSEEKPTSPKPLPISLYSSENPPESSLSTYAPYGRLIPCETVITLESSKLDTPVVGLVTEDVWHDGQLVIPAGAEIHGRAALDHSRERISANGKWIVVWRDSGPMNGTELVLSGIALDRDKDDVNGEFGLRDGSAGLRGELIKSDDLQEIKLFASTFLSGVSSGLAQLRSQTTALGDLAQVPVVSGRNAALQGTSEVLNAYARQIQEAIARDGFFVRIPAGKQFYLYVTETIDQTKGTRGNAHTTELWKK